MTPLVPALAVLLLGASVWECAAQRRGARRRPDAELPRWEIKTDHPQDLFTFVRIEYDDMGGYGWRGGKCMTDYPDADLNFSYRLQELTSLKADPNGLVLRLTDPRLKDYPFIYMVEPGDLTFRNAEVTALRQYLLNGGFLMVDDFWGDYEYENFFREIKRVFPDRDPQALGLDHEIFNMVFPLAQTLPSLPQIPNMNRGTFSQFDGVTWEPDKGPGAEVPRYQAIFDDQGRIMVIICHNTDLGDGWEREGYNEYYFREFSEKKAYPLGINIVFYAMTH